jgi:hypothetical protein
MRSFFLATVSSFAATAAVWAISAVTVWLWHLDMGRVIDLHDLSAWESFLSGY